MSGGGDDSKGFGVSSWLMGLVALLLVGLVSAVWAGRNDVIEGRVAAQEAKVKTQETKLEQVDAMRVDFARLEEKLDALTEDVKAVKQALNEPAKKPRR